MTMQIAQRIPFRPSQCTQCTYYLKEIQRCKAYTTESYPRPLLGVFRGESGDACPRFEAGTRLPVKQPIEATGVHVPEAEEAAAAETIEEIAGSSERIESDDPAWREAARRRRWMVRWPGMLSV